MKQCNFHIEKKFQNQSVKTKQVHKNCSCMQKKIVPVQPLLDIGTYGAHDFRI